MASSWTIVRIMGIPIRINITLVLFLPILAWLISRETYLEANLELLELIGPHEFELALLMDGYTPWIIGVLAAVGLFVGVTLHELGHAWMAMRYDIGITSITLWIFGGLARLEDIPEEWDTEFWIALAGPVTSVLIGVIAYVAYVIMPDIGHTALFIVGWLAFINIILAIFNMLPAFPMDGGRILRALLARNRPYVDATRTAASIGKGFAVGMAVLGILAFAPLLILVAMFVYIAATGESRATVLRDLLRGVTVRDLMRPASDALTTDMTAHAALDAMMSRRESAIPVVGEDGGYYGTVTIAHMNQLTADQRIEQSLKDIADREGPTVGPMDDVFDVVQVMASHRLDRVAVVEDDQLVGFLAHRDIVDAIEIFQGLKSGRPEVIPGSGYP